MPVENHLLGYCPICKNPGYSRERRPNGNDTCINKHVYPSDKALVPRRWIVEVTDGALWPKLETDHDGPQWITVEEVLE